MNSPNFGYLTYFGRIVYALLFVVLFIEPWFRVTAEPFRELSTAIIKSIPIMALLFFVQLLPIPVITDIAHLLYGTEKLRDIFSAGTRVYGSLHNANWAGVYLLVAWVAIIWRWQQGYTSNRVAIAYIFIVAWMLISTGSRTGLIGVVLTTFWLILLGISFRHGRRILVRIVLVLSGCIGIGWFLLEYDILPNLKRFRNFFTANQLEDVASVAGRFDAWNKGIDHFLTDPWVGPGVEGIPHNSFISWLQAFGIIGFCGLMLIFSILIMSWLRNRFSAEMQFASAIFFGFVIMSMTAEFFFTTQLVLIVLPFVVGPFFVKRDRIYSM